ncbi:hypothetical protein DFH06DRAFT_1135978 [Mycena polygramma]|nr:hypothetical protein DFH06DRAFT_1135978 [Mycena polygramma]
MASSTAPPSPPSDADSSDGESIGDLDVVSRSCHAFNLPLIPSQTPCASATLPLFVVSLHRAFACGEDIPTFAAASLRTAIKYLARVDAFKLHFYEDDDHSLRQVATVWFNLDGVLTDQWTELEYFADSHPARWYTAYPTFWQAKDSTRGILAGKYSDPIDELTYLVGDCITANPESKRVEQIGPLWFQIVFEHPNEWQVTSYIAEAEQLSRLPGARQIFRVFPDESAAQGPRSTSTQLAIRAPIRTSTWTGLYVLLGRTLKSQDVASQPHVVM